MLCVNLFTEYTEGNGSLISCELPKSLKIHLEEKHVFMLKKFDVNFKKSGFHWTLQENEKILKIYRIPKCLYRTFLNKSVSTSLY